ncbi:DUF5305 domain-containing protein [Halorientalis halophila]|uniref:DUF5305 domain-containing protein n=1 Tax=Halorientalis halophila TaxID=3108499 RepID=UPI0030084162
MTPPPSTADSAAVDRWDRLRVALADWRTLLLVLGVLALAGGGLLVFDTHVAPGTAEERRTEVLFERSGGYDHRATVARSTDLYPAGTTLRDRSVYFTSVAPVLNGTLVYRYDSPHDDPVTVTTRAELVTRSVDRTGETEYWRETRPLAGSESTTVAGDGVVRVPFGVNVSALADRADRIDADLGGDPGRPEATVRTTVRVRGTIEGRPVDLTEAYELHLGLGGATYAVSQGDRETTAVETTDTATVPATYGPVRGVGSVLLLLVGSAGLVGLGTLQLTGRLAVSAEERERLAFAADRAAYDDWITTGALAGDVASRPTFAVASLDALVDAAIDSETRVLHVPDRGRYLVVTDALVYVYEPPGTAPSQ